MSLGSTQHLTNTYSVSIQFGSGFGIDIDESDFSGSPNLTDIQTLVDALRGAGVTVSARQYSDEYKDILTP